MVQELKNHGFNHIDTLENQDKSLSVDEFKSLPTNKTKAVILGINKSFNFRKLCILSLHLENKDVEFYVTNEDRIYSAGCHKGMDGQTRYVADIGAILKAVETAAGRSAVRIGKPERHAFESIKRDHF